MSLRSLLSERETIEVQQSVKRDSDELKTCMELLRRSGVLGRLIAYDEWKEAKSMWLDLKRKWQHRVNTTSGLTTPAGLEQHIRAQERVNFLDELLSEIEWQGSYSFREELAGYVVRLKTKLRSFGERI